MFETAPLKSIAPCSLRFWMNGLSESDQGNLQKWLDADWVSHEEILRQIKSEADKGFGKQTISDHRNSRCACSRK